MAAMLKALVARLWFGARAARAIDDARRDLAERPLPEAIAPRDALPVGRAPRRTAVRALARAVNDRLAREGISGPCLLRGLALLGEARRLGFAPRLVIGLRDEGDALGGHAWLELDGRPFLESAAATDPFVPVYSSAARGGRPGPR
jgi:hypothetical protein